MKNKITIAIDAMGGENAPDKTILGLSIFYKREKNVNKTFFLLYGKLQMVSSIICARDVLKKYAPFFIKWAINPGC